MPVESIEMNRVTDSSKESWIARLDLLIEGGVLLFIVLFPIKSIFWIDNEIAILKWMALYLPFIFWIVKMAIQKEFKWVRTPIDLPLFLYGVVIVASVAYSIDQVNTIAGIRGSFLKAIILFSVILNNLRTPAQLKRLATAFVVSFFFVVGAGFYNYQAGSYNIAGGITSFGNTHHNIMGKILGGLFPFLLLAFSLAKRPVWKGLSLFLALVGLFAIFMTLSRATWGGAVVTFLIWGAFQNWKRSLAVLTLFLFSIFLFGPDSVASRWGQLEHHIGTISGRTPIWGVAIEQIRDRPLFGYGYGLSIFEKIWTEEGEEVSVPHEHNVILALLVQNGLAGLSLYLWIFVGTLILAFRKIRVLSDGLERNILIVIFSGIIGEYFVHAMFDRNNVGNWALPAWAMVAMVMVILSQGASSSKGASPEALGPSAADRPRDLGVSR